MLDVNKDERTRITSTPPYPVIPSASAAGATLLALAANQVVAGWPRRQAADSAQHDRPLTAYL